MANVPGEPLGPEGGKVERTPKKSGKLKNLTPKNKVDELAESVKDIYSIVDSLLGSAVAFSGREYPEGLFCVSDEIASKLAKNLIIVNSSVPRIGQHVSKVAAPILLITTLLTDLSTKAVILYGIFKSPKVSPGNNPAVKG